MGDAQGGIVVGRDAVFGSVAAVVGLFACDVTSAILPSFTFGTASLGAGGALAPLSRNFGVLQTILAAVLLAYSGFLGGVIVGCFTPSLAGFWAGSRCYRILRAAIFGAVAVGVGSLWLAAMPFGISFLLSATMGDLPLAIIGYFVVGLIGGAIAGMIAVAWPHPDNTEGDDSRATGDGVQAVFAHILSKPVTVSVILSCLVLPGLLTAAAAVDRVVAEVVIAVGGSLFFGFCVSFALAAATDLSRISNRGFEVGLTLVGIPAGAVSAVLGNGLLHAIGSGTLGENASHASMEGMFLFWLSVPIGAAAGLLWAPIAHPLFRRVRREWTEGGQIGQRDELVPGIDIRLFVLGAIVLVLFLASVWSRFHVESSERLLNAVIDANLSIVKRSVAVGADPDHLSPTGWTPLSAAVDNNEPELVDFLLKRGADPSKRGRTKSLIHRAAQLESPKMVGLLLAAGADPNGAVFRGIRPIDVGAGSFEVVRLLLEAGADPRDKDGRSPLQYAITHGNPEGAQLMLAAGVDPDPEERLLRSRTVYYAAERGYGGLLNDLLARGATFDWDSQTAQELLSDVAERGNTDVAAILIDRGVDMDADYSLHAALQKGQEETAMLMIERGANVQLANEKNSTPLHLAIWRRNLEAAKALLDRGADVNAQTISGDTPLHYACGGVVERLRKETIELLLEHGADARIQNDARQTPWDEASRYQKEIIEEFEEAQRR